MCGRYAASRDAAALVEVLHDLGIALHVDDGAAAVPATFNMAPTRQGLVLAPRRPGGADGSDAGDPSVRLTALSWGLVPSWSKDRRGAARMINARAESVPDRPAFRSLLTTRRCLVPVDGWYEWLAREDGKWPHLVHPAPATGSAPRRDPAAGAPLLMLAGLFTWWRDPAAAADPQTGDTSWFGSYTIITGPARDDLAWLHDRMPVVVAPRWWQDWLHPDGADATGLLDAVRHDLADPGVVPLASHPVTRRVGSVANDDPALVLADPHPRPEPPGSAVPQPE